MTSNLGKQIDSSWRMVATADISSCFAGKFCGVVPRPHGESFPVANPSQANLQGLEASAIIGTSDPFVSASDKIEDVQRFQEQV